LLKVRRRPPVCCLEKKNTGRILLALITSDKCQILSDSVKFTSFLQKCDNYWVCSVKKMEKCRVVSNCVGWLSLPLAGRHGGSWSLAKVSGFVMFKNSNPPQAGKPQRRRVRREIAEIDYWLIHLFAFINIIARAVKGDAKYSPQRRRER